VRAVGDDSSKRIQTEREKTKMVQELMEQNHRLTNELKEVSLSVNSLCPLIIV